MCHLNRESRAYAHKLLLHSLQKKKKKKNPTTRFLFLMSKTCLVTAVQYILGLEMQRQKVSTQPCKASFQEFDYINCESQYTVNFQESKAFVPFNLNTGSGCLTLGSEGAFGRRRYQPLIRIYNCPPCVAA